MTTLPKSLAWRKAKETKDAGAAGSKCGGHGYRGCSSGGVGRQRTVGPAACHTLGPVTGEGRRSEKAPVPWNFAPCPQPPLQLGGALGSSEPGRNAVRCVQPPCSRFRVLCPAAQVESLSCAFEEQEEAEQGSAKQYCISIASSGTRGDQGQVSHSRDGLDSEECAWWRGRPGPAPVTRPTPPVPAPRQREPKAQPPLPLSPARALGADTQALGTPPPGHRAGCTPPSPTHSLGLF